jgi:RHS repeat-associated protein
MAQYTPSLSEHRGTASKFYHSDFLGTNTKITDSAASTTDSRNYDAYGLLVSSTGTTPAPFGFAGQSGYQEDSDSSLKLLGERYYDSSIGRFLTRDRIKDGRNWYTYCGNNPLAYTDPEGTSPFDWVDGIFGKGGLGFGVGIVVGGGKYGVPRPDGMFMWVDRSLRGGRGGRIIHIDLPHGRLTSVHINSTTGLLKGLDHTELPPVFGTIGKNVFLRGVGHGLILLSVALDAYDIFTAPPGHVGAPIGGAAGGWGGAVLGAEIGSLIFPGVGTVVGGVIGGIAGYFGGRAIGGSFDDP